MVIRDYGKSAKNHRLHKHEFVLIHPPAQKKKWQTFVCPTLQIELSTEKNPGCLGSIGDHMDYTTQLYRDCNMIVINLYKDPY